MEIERLRETALACYDKFPDEQKDKAYAVFEAMDSDGNGTVSLEEYKEFFGTSSGASFRQLNENGDGKLDFYEFITLFFIMKSKGDSADMGVPTLIITTQDQPKSSKWYHLRQSNSGEIGRSKREAVLKAVGEFNSGWEIGSAIGGTITAIAVAAGFCTIM